MTKEADEINVGETTSGKVFISFDVGAESHAFRIDRRLAEFLVLRVREIIVKQVTPIEGKLAPVSNHGATYPER